MAEGGGTSFWKVFFGVVAGIAVVGGCVIGACVMLLGKAAVNVAESEKARQQYATRMSVEVTEFVGERGYSHVRGSITNNGDKTVKYWRANVRFRDKAGAVIDTAMTNSLETLGPGESKNFDVMHRTDPRFKTVTVDVEEVHTQ